MRKLLLVLLVVGAAVLLHDARPATAAKSCTIPAAWGQVKAAVVVATIGLNTPYLYLEASDGTIRQVLPENCKLITEITRTP